jgi:hypothetical protein
VLQQPLHSIFTTFCSLNHGRFLPFVFNLDFHILVSLQTLQCTRVKWCTWVIPALASPLYWDRKLKILSVQWETGNNHVLAAVVRAQMMRPELTRKRAGGPTSAVDRLSALPDELLHVILSFLPAPLVVQTSLLSRRMPWVNSACVVESIIGVMWIDGFVVALSIVLLCSRLDY